jgi:hypothetical protein
MKPDKQNPACGGRVCKSTVHLGGSNSPEANPSPLAFQALSQTGVTAGNFVSIGLLANLVVDRVALSMAGVAA